MSMSNAVALRDDSAALATQQAALAIHAGQTTWDEYQNAALNQLGLREAGNGDKAVFLHVCQRTGLDPFAKQIYMIGRPEQQEDGKWGKKWTIQTGIKGWRVIRDRAERREGVRGKLSRFTYYDDKDNERQVWTRPEPPVVCEITYTVRDRNGIETPYTAQLRFAEYVQRKKDGTPNKMWTEKAVHMLEKCTEAAVYALAFPEDFSGLFLDDAMPAPAGDDDEPAPPQRPRVDAAQARNRAQAHTVTATVVTPEPSPVAPESPVSGPPAPPAAAAGEVTIGDLRGEVNRLLEQRGVTNVANRVRIAEHIAGMSGSQLTEADAVRLRDTIELMDSAAIDGVLAEITMADEPDGDAGE